MTALIKTDALKPILYVEDETDDVFYMQRAFKQAGIKHPLECAADVQEAWSFLADDETGRPRLAPALILLDLNLPASSGFELLKRLRSTPALLTVPVVVLTSSNHESDIKRAALLGANGYLVKPQSLDKLLQMVKTVRDYWLSNDVFVQQALGTGSETAMYNV
jgi:CheY-like chemotaxis protein